uniref:Uncharacterized protein n=1 Tax=Leersia perrieri TaxID=77586 RepID=A0A0D9XLE5_9ORYZ
MGFSCRLFAQALLLLIIVAVLAPATSMAAITTKQHGQKSHACGGDGGSHASPATTRPPCSGHRGQIPARMLGLRGIRAPPPPRPHPPVSYARPQPPSMICPPPPPESL